MQNRGTIDNKISEDEEIVHAIKAFVNNSSMLELSQTHHIKNGQVSVNVTNTDKPKKVVKELIQLVKLSKTNDESYLFVRNTTPNIVITRVKNVTFWKDSNFSGTRMTKTEAAEILTNTQTEKPTTT